MTDKEHSKSVEVLFGLFQGELDTETQDRENIRETTKQLERHSKKIETIWLKIHQEPCAPEVCTSIHEILKTQVEPLYNQLALKVPMGKFYVYLDLWRNTTRRLVGSCCLIQYLETETLLSYEQSAASLGLPTHENKTSIFLELEDYLFGVLDLTAVLSRYCTNCVTQGDYSRPTRIGQFLNDVNNGFRLLNLKNDQLRKAYDRLKWDLKKVEDVIYDVSIRGLSPAVSKVEEKAANEGSISAASSTQVATATSTMATIKLSSEATPPPKNLENLSTPSENSIL